MRDLPVIKVYKATDIIRLLVLSSWDPLHLQTNRVLRAKLKNFNSKPVQIQFHASDLYNSSRRLAISEPGLTSEPLKLAQKTLEKNQWLQVLSK